MSTPLNGRQRAVDSLVAIAIAALDQALPLSGTVSAAVLRSAFSAPPAQMGIDEKVVDQVRRWATREGLQEDLEAGLALAKQTLGDLNATPTTLADANYDSEVASDRVIQAAHNDPAWGGQIKRWGPDNRYAIAERAIRVVYDTLIAELQTAEPAVPGLASLGVRVDELITQVGRLQQVGAPTKNQVINYLTTRLADWDRPVWGFQTQITMPRRVHLRPPATSGASGQGRTLSDEDALQRHEMLVVLGGPGSGKTWLSRSYAREAADRALDSLASGAVLSDIEVPVFVTWDQWSGSGGGVRESLVDASFAAGSGHSVTAGDAAVKQFLLDPATRVLLIVDSLDEAANHQGQANRLHELTSLLPAWRVVVTSRPAAWERTASTLPSSRGLGIADLQDLSYPSEVNAFVRSWFEFDQDLATTLLTQIHARPELAGPAGSPLMLTIYCLLTEHDPERGLPTRRHRLYDALASQLLKRYDKNLGMNEPLRHEERVRILGQWAWHAVGSSDDTYTGLGNWADTFTTPNEPAPVDAVALEEIAPRTNSGGPVGRTVRRFVHRTLLEHFVALHVSALDADHAFRTLLPHLWFDPDWQTAAPAAVAAHNRAHRGELFERILTAVRTPLSATDGTVARAGHELDGFLLAVAEESDPAEWRQDHQAILQACRIRNAVVWPDRMARTAHWHASNTEVIRQVVDRMAARTREKRFRESDWEKYVHFDGQDLPGLAHTDADRLTLRSALMDRLETAADGGRFELLVGSVGMGHINEVDRPALLDILVGLPNGNDALHGNDLAMFIHLAPEGLTLLAQSEVERARVADRLREDLGGVDYGLYIVRGMQLLERPEGELEHVRNAFISAVQYWGGMERDLAEAFHQIDPSRAQRDVVAEVLLSKMDQTNEHVTEHSAWQARSLARINPTGQQKERARSILIRQLAENTRAWKVREVVKALVSLDATVSDRRSAIEIMLIAIGNQYDVDDEMFDAFTLLGPSTTDTARARRQVLHILETGDHAYTDDVAEWLASLDPTEDERTHTREVLLERLDENLTSNTRALLSLRPTHAELTRAREIVLRSIQDSDASTIVEAATVLPRLKPTRRDREVARERLRSAEANYAAPGQHWFDPQLREYINALLPLGPTPDEQARAREVILDSLSNPNDNIRLPLLRQTSTPQAWLRWIDEA
ncbi:NACHT domain-containing protein [Promicromonospora sp. NPDC057488]|uniref:NACHT domain-containing protein n=1 Tax=Promicromonospora sp. NPDC057488 TaxID=3346147 RepID=UPI00366C2525